jgi:membrane protein YqaA with SNARE-associated domain
VRGGGLGQEFALRRWASKWNISAFVWGFAEATLFFIVPDVLLSYIGMKRGMRAGAVASVFAAVGAGLGGMAMFMWSVRDPAHARAAVLDVPAINEAMARAAEASIAAQGWFLATLLGPLSTTPYKLYAIAAPHAGAPLWLFAAASVATRLPRFVLAGAGSSIIARRLAPILGERRLIWVYASAWVLFYVAYLSLNPS